MVAEARQFFKCTEPTAEGIPLENGGSEHDIGRHFEKVNFGYEAMTAQMGTGSKSFSKFTFLLYEQSGWFLPVYENVQPFTYGQNEGCDFMNGKCP